MLRKTLLSGVLSIALVATSMPAVAAPLAPSEPAIDKSAVTLVGRKRIRRGHARWRGHRNRVVVHRFHRGGRYWRGHHWDDDFDGFGVAAGIIGFGLGAALAAGAAHDRDCYVRQGGILYRVHCSSLH